MATITKTYENVKAEMEEQPEPESMRFRYVSEGPTAGSIVGVNSTEDVKTYPAIRVGNYDGAARVIVSCVSDEKRPKPHPNSLIGAKGCTHGVYQHDFIANSTVPAIVRFKKIGIQRAKKEQLKACLEEREKLRIDPFRTGFDHKHRPKSIDVHRIRLCFQVFLMPDPANPKQLIALKPFVSDPIVDKQSVNTLHIHEISDNSCRPSGKKKIMLFCNKVDKNDIGIKFYEKDAEGKTVWEDWGSFQPHNVHKQVAIAFETPKYRVADIDSPVTVYFCLQTIKGNTAYSNSVPFQYVPDPSYPLNPKKRKIDDSTSLYEYLEINGTNNRHQPTIQTTYNIPPNEPGRGETCAPENFNFVASSFDASNNNLMPALSQHEQYQPVQQSNYEWPQHQNRLADHEPHLSPEVQSQAHHSTYNRHGEHGNVYGATNNLNANFSRPSHPIGNQSYQQYQQQSNFEWPQQTHQQNRLADHEPQFSYQPAVHSQSHHSTYNHRHSEHGATNNLNANFSQPSQPIGNQSYEMPVQSSHHPCQQVGPVYAADKVIIQQFCNANVTFNQNQQESVTEILQNLSDYCNQN